MRLLVMAAGLLAALPAQALVKDINSVATNPGSNAYGFFAGPAGSPASLAT